MKKISTDINCDMGEMDLAHDEALLPYITSCNLCCGMHAGSFGDIEKLAFLVGSKDIPVGAHPSYPDKENFGRKIIPITEEALRDSLINQITYLHEVLQLSGGPGISYVKPHGALYNEMAESEMRSRVVIELIQDIDPNIALMGLAGSVTETVANELKIQFIPEAFADRRYQKDGMLVPRSEEGAVLSDPNEAAAQALSLVVDQTVTTVDGALLPIKAQSICVHGDHPNALETLKAIHRLFSENGIQIKSNFILE